MKIQDKPQNKGEVGYEPVIILEATMSIVPHYCYTTPYAKIKIKYHHYLIHRIALAVTLTLISALCVLMKLSRLAFNSKMEVANKMR